MRGTAVVLLQMGGPESVADLEPFLENLFRDPDIIQLPRLVRPMQGWLARRIARSRAPRMAPRYEEIGGGSPLRRHTEAQAANLRAELARRKSPTEVVVAMRYAEPRATTALQTLEEIGSPDVTLLPLYPHWSRATTGSSVTEFLAEASRAGYPGAIRPIRAWGEHPGYVGLLREQVAAAAEAVRASTGGPLHLLFTAHGLPRRYADAGDPYPREVEATAQLVAEGWPADSWSLSYQSAVGPVEWLRPYTHEHLADLADRGVRGVVCVPLGFVSDHIETLYDVDVTFASIARERRLVFERTPSFNADPRFARVLADVLRDVPRGPQALAPEAAA